MPILDLKMRKLEAVKRLDFHNLAEKEDEVISLDIVVKGDRNGRFLDLFVFADHADQFVYDFAHDVFGCVAAALWGFYIESNFTDCDSYFTTNSFLFSPYFCLSCGYFRFTWSSYLNILR